MKITAKAITLVGLCALLPLVATSLTLFYSARHTLREQAGAELALVNRATFRLVQNFVEDARADLDAWSGLLVMQDVLIGDAQGDLATELESLRTRYPRFTALAVTDRAGEVIAVAGGVRDDLDLGDAAVLASASTGETYLSEVEPTPLTGAPGLTLGAPIRADYDPETIIGGLIGVVGWDQVSTMLEGVLVAGAAQGERHVLILLDHGRHGVLYKTASAPDDLDAGVLAAAFHRPGEDHPQAGAGGGPAGSVAAPNGAREVETGSGAYLVATALPDGDLPLEWEMYGAVASEVVFAPVDELRTHFLAIAAVAAVLALLLGRLAGRWLTRPITAMIGTALRASVERYDLAVSGSNEAVWDWDAVGDTIYVSPRFRALTGLPDEARAIGPAEWEALVHPDDLELHRRAVLAHLRGETPFLGAEYRVRRPEGGHRWVQNRGIGVRDENGRVYRMAGSFGDVTARREAEEGLRQARDPAGLARKAVKTARRRSADPRRHPVAAGMARERRAGAPVSSTRRSRRRSRAPRAAPPGPRRRSRRAHSSAGAPPAAWG